MKYTVIIAALAIFHSVTFTGCKQSDQKKSSQDIPENAVDPGIIDNPSTPSGNSEAESLLPVFEFEEEDFDFGTVNEGETVTHAYKFKNTGKSDLIISSASGSCGCTVPEWPKEAIAPGKTGVINVKFSSEGKPGMQRKTVTLVANTIPNSKVLSISGEVIAKK